MNVLLLLFYVVPLVICFIGSAYFKSRDEELSEKIMVVGIIPFGNFIFTIIGIVTLILIFYAKSW